MNDGLNPIKHVYGEEPSGPAPTPGTPEYAEFEALRTTKEALDALPHPLPKENVTDAVKAAALTKILQPLRDAYGGEVASLDADDARLAEFELLRTMKSALDMLPKVRPDALVLDAVKTAAVARALAPVQAVYGEGAVPDPESAQYAEYALLKSTKSALDQLPVARPDASAVAAVLAAAKPGAPALRVASDRPARSASVVRRWTPALAMAASLVVVAVTGLWVAQVFPGQNDANSELVADAQHALAEDNAGAFDAPAEAEDVLEEAPASGLFSIPFGDSGQPTVSQDRLDGYVAARAPSPVNRGRAERREFAQTQPVSSPPPGLAADALAENETVLAGGLADLREADTNEPTTTVSEWDAGEDVRVLSLRLNQLANSSEGLSWDEPPTPLGAAAIPTDTPMEGIRAVRSGASPARVDVQLRSSEQRDDQ